MKAPVQILIFLSALTFALNLTACGKPKGKNRTALRASGKGNPANKITGNGKAVDGKNNKKGGNTSGQSSDRVSDSLGQPGTKLTQTQIDNFKKADSTKQLKTSTKISEQNFLNDIQVPGDSLALESLANRKYELIEVQSSLYLADSKPFRGLVQLVRQSRNSDQFILAGKYFSDQSKISNYKDAIFSFGAPIQLEISKNLKTKTKTQSPEDHKNSFDLKFETDNDLTFDFLFESAKQAYFSYSADLSQNEFHITNFLIDAKLANSTGQKIKYQGPSKGDLTSTIQVFEVGNQLKILVIIDTSGDPARARTILLTYDSRIESV